ncbi:MAG: hypothetical protein A2151_02805 [Candidatus Muproteobacteria bacterium RBG_16_65_34]|uniref:Two-component system response regulator n=1 Tax=Candidatus Muproteobacteria bacterium RBG_16_65_34 TaxID=1817760 RepID=A0A1F6TSI9_9PROT|nr:MAG: hypothetical protein A2151_02805 [Candidatus Muproteobacteria bacterium RBG_16_65_34]
MQRTILLIEDESPNRAIVKRVLHHMPLTFLEAENVQQALELSGTGPVDLVLLDIGLPMADGYTFLERFRADAVNQAIPVCVMTGRTEDRHRRKAIEMGADDFIVKPVDNVELETRVKSLLRIREYQKRLLDANATLEGRVQERTAYLRAVLDELEHAWGENTLAYREMVMRLALAAEYKDKVTAAHIERMSHYSALLARRCGWSDEETVLLLEAAKMHDIGKIGIPDAILHKQERLTAPEYAVIKQHPQIGAAILAGSKSRLLQLAEQIALTHHERWDGTGYPQGLKGKDIPEVGRIVAIADVFDALLTRRPYKEPWPLTKAFDVMREGAGVHFDPELVEIFLANHGALLEIYGRFPDNGENNPPQGYLTPRPAANAAGTA